MLSGEEKQAAPEAPKPPHRYSIAAGGKMTIEIDLGRSNVMETLGFLIIMNDVVRKAYADAMEASKPKIHTVKGGLFQSMRNFVSSK